MKIFKHRNLMGLIYSVLLAIPLLSLAVRCGYVMWNKNANASYSGTNNTSSLINVELNELIENETYIINIPAGTTMSSTFDLRFYVEDVVNLNNNTSIETASINLYQSNSTLYYFEVVNNTNVNYTQVNLTGLNLQFKYLSTFRNTLGTDIEPYLFKNTYVEKYYLDNAFIYSVSQITNNNQNTGLINFVGIFDDLFLDLSDSTNQLYLGFVNYYMNYVLLVSLVYILFLVLMWFINFVRKMLEKGMDFGQRGY